MKTVFIDWNLIPYAEAWQRQTEWFDNIVRAKVQGESYENRIVMCEHPHVYTLGRSGKENNMLLSDEQLKAIDATLYHIDRGGDITYHGPGQLVCYPILNLEEFQLGLKEYVHLLEEAVIRVCASYGIEAGRLEKATGVWLEGDTPRARKICAIGVRSSHYVTMHGLALNVNTDLRYFSYIHPCGFIDKGVTSLRQELKHDVPMDEVKQRSKRSLENYSNSQLPGAAHKAIFISKAYEKSARIGQKFIPQLECRSCLLLYLCLRNDIPHGQHHISGNYIRLLCQPGDDGFQRGADS